MKFWLLTLAASLAAGGGALAKPRKAENDARPAAAASVGGPNGVWTIEATTSVGNCPGLIPASLQIAENKISAATGANVSVWGYVDGEGNLVARFTGDGGRVVRFSGQLRGGRGSGAWSSSTDMCGGAWRASRG